MKYTVYGLRRAGSCQLRYIGQTGNKPITRLHAHIQAAASQRRFPVHHWILEVAADGDAIEVIEMSVHDERADARAAEREAIETFSRAGHSLVNVWLNPTVTERRRFMAKA